MSQGLFYLNAQSDGTTLATRPLVGELMLDANGRRVADQAINMNLTDLRTRVGQTAARPGSVVNRGTVK